MSHFCSFHSLSLDNSLCIGGGGGEGAQFSFLFFIIKGGI